MTGFSRKLISAFGKQVRIRPAPTRRRRTALRLESLEQRSMFTGMAPIGAPLSDLMPAGGDTELSAEVESNRGGTVADDVIVDGRIITGENFDSASSGDPSIVRKMVGRTSYQPASTSPYGGNAGRDVLLGGLGDDYLASRASASGHTGAMNALFGDGSVHFIRASIFDRDILVMNDVKRETDASSATDPFQSEWKYVPVRRMALSHSSDTGSDLGGRQISFTGLEQTDSDGSARSATDQTIDFSALFEFVEGAAKTGGHVKVFDATSVRELPSFFAFPGFNGGVYVAAGDVNGDGRDDIIVGAGRGAPGGHVKVIDGTRLGEIGNDWLVGGTGRDIAIAVGVFDGASGVWHLRNSNSTGTPDNNHGTHVAGTIGAVGNNSIPAQSGSPGPTSSIVLTFQGDRLDLAADGTGITSGSTKVWVAVMDTGIDYRHADLYRNIWINHGSGDEFVSAASSQSSVRVHYDTGYGNSITIRSGKN
jgi:hypothetical protein